MKAEYLQSRRRNVSENRIFVKRHFLSKVGGNRNIVFRSKATGIVGKEQEGESISALYPHGIK